MIGDPLQKAARSSGMLTNHRSANAGVSRFVRKSSSVGNRVARGSRAVAGPRSRIVPAAIAKDVPYGSTRRRAASRRRESLPRDDSVAERARFNRVAGFGCVPESRASRWRGRVQSPRLGHRLIWQGPARLDIATELPIDGGERKVGRAWSPTAASRRVTRGANQRAPKDIVGRANSTPHSAGRLASGRSWGRREALANDERERGAATPPRSTNRASAGPPHARAPTRRNRRGRARTD